MVLNRYRCQVQFDGDSLKQNVNGCIHENQKRFTTPSYTIEEDARASGNPGNFQLVLMRLTPWNEQGVNQLSQFYIQISKRRERNRKGGG